MKKNVAKKLKKAISKSAKSVIDKDSSNKNAADEVALEDTTAEETDIKPEENRSVSVKYGKLVYDFKFQTLKIIAIIVFLLLVCTILLSLRLFDSAIRIRNHLGYFINMVSEGGEGAKLPMFQSIPVLMFLLLDIIFMIALWNIFKRKPQLKYNWLLFITILVDVIFILGTFIFLFVIMSHIYEAHTYIHDGIVEAMNNYSSNSLFKKQIDRLQIEFQCCGSKKYDEWYNIQWFDTSLIKAGRSEKTHSNAPFSCCSISSLFPCVHHNIENTGKAYLYTPEQNLSISTTGCHEKILKKTKEVGWGIIGNLFLFIIIQVVLVVGLRFLQTAHFAKFMFEDQDRLYTVWIFGCALNKASKTSNLPPPVPPVPEELMK